VDYLLRIDGIPGEASDKARPASFEIKDFSFGVDNPTTIGSATGGAGAGKGKFNEFTIKKTVDSATPAFFKNCVAGQHYTSVTVEMRKAGGDPGAAAKPYLQFTFGTVFTTKIDWSGPGDEGPEESITFVYGKLAVQYFKQTAAGSTAFNPAEMMLADLNRDGRADLLALWDPWDVNPGSLPPGVGGLARGPVDNDDAEVVFCRLPDAPANHPNSNSVAAGTAPPLSDSFFDITYRVDFTGAPNLMASGAPTMPFGGSVPVMIGDVNGDGILDIVVANANGRTAPQPPPLSFNTEGPIICQALFQRLAPQAPQYGSQINPAGDRLNVYLDPPRGPLLPDFGQDLVTPPASNGPVCFDFGQDLGSKARK
jgi:type VI secretion system secreted protein Hcp